MRFLQLFLAIFVLINSAYADTVYVCKQGENERTIELAYSGDAQVPCEVRYTKGNETGVLWAAQKELGYCETKAKAFVEKQRGWGWQCDESEAETDE